MVSGRKVDCCVSDGGGNQSKQPSNLRDCINVAVRGGTANTARYLRPCRHHAMMMMR